MDSDSDTILNHIGICIGSHGGFLAIFGLGYGTNEKNCAGSIFGFRYATMWKLLYCICIWIQIYGTIQKNCTGKFQYRKNTGVYIFINTKENANSSKL